MNDVVEWVLCSPRASLPARWLPLAGAVAMREGDLAGVLDGISPTWLPRSVAEADEGHKQWITYGLVREPGGRLACYRRRGTETRLHGARSLGVGGHVNPVDAGETDVVGFSWRGTLWNGFRRELAEELPMAVPGETRFLGLIHEDMSPVGRVHVGVVFLHETRTPAPMEPGELLGLEWVMPPAGEWSGEDGPELWSRLALKLLQG